LMLPAFSGIFISALAPSALRMGFRILDRKVETVFVARLGRNVEEMAARFSACRFPSRQNVRPSGETTGRWDVSRARNPHWTHAVDGYTVWS